MPFHAIRHAISAIVNASSFFSAASEWGAGESHHPTTVRDACPQQRKTLTWSDPSSGLGRMSIFASRGRQIGKEWSWPGLLRIVASGNQGRLSHRTTFVLFSHPLKLKPWILYLLQLCQGRSEIELGSIVDTAYNDIMNRLSFLVGIEGLIIWFPSSEYSCLLAYREKYSRQHSLISVFSVQFKVWSKRRYSYLP